MYMDDRCISCWILFFWLYMVENSYSHPCIYYTCVLKSLNGQWTDTLVSNGNGLVQVNVYSAGTGD